MKALWKKDLLTVRPYLKLLALFWALVYPLNFLFKTDDGLLCILQVIVGVLIVGLTPIQMDAINQGYNQIFSLPIRRQDYVRQKFLLNGGVILSSYLINLSVFVLLYTIKGTPQLIPQLVLVQTGLIFLMTVIFGCYLIRVIPSGAMLLGHLMGTVFGIPFLVIACGLFLDSQGVNLQSWLDFGFSLPPVVVVFAGLSLSALVWLLCCGITEKSFVKTDIDTSRAVKI